MTEDVIDVESTALAVRSAAPAVTWTPTFAIAVDDAIERKSQKRRFFEGVMDRDVHYGVIPGTGTKPTLLKPGAEMLLANMGLQPSFSDAEPPTYDITGELHNGEAFIKYRRICRIYRQLGSHENERMIVAQAEGSCSSWETKYRYRNDSLKCPKCGKACIIKGKAEYGGGYICFAKKGGCGAKYGDKDAAIVSQPIGKVANPDLADVDNTILKMADKRALVAATLLATGCSDIFTQDVEDQTQSDSAPIDAQYTQHVEQPPTPPERPEAPATADLVRMFDELQIATANVPTFGKWVAENIDIDFPKRKPMRLTEDERRIIATWFPAVVAQREIDEREKAAEAAALSNGKPEPAESLASIDELRASLGWSEAELQDFVAEVSGGESDWRSLSSAKRGDVQYAMSLELGARETAAR